MLPLNLDQRLSFVLPRKYSGVVIKARRTDRHDRPTAQTVEDAGKLGRDITTTHNNRCGKASGRRFR